jgi:signal transduction histidine kinase
MSAVAFATETVAPLWRRRTWAAALYLCLSMPIGSIAFLLLVVGFAVGIGLSVVWIGVPILLGLLAASRAFAAFDRGLANRLLGTAIPAPAAQRSREGTLLKQVTTLVRSRTTWRALVWLFVRFPLSLITFCLPVIVATAGGALVAAPFSSAFTNADPVFGSSAATTALCIAGGCALLLLTAHLIEGLAWLHGALARGLLGPSRSEELALLAARSERADARANLARELHDSVGHSVTAAVLQASAARRVQESDPAFTADALAAIEAQGRQALDELDRVLAVLRDERGETSSSPTLADVDDLVARTRAAGIQLAVKRSGDLERVPDAVGRDAYRVLQEALTNVMRHASGSSATVSLAVGERTLDLTVENGPGVSIQPDRTSGGNGLRGVRERVRALGGSLATDETADGGYVLHAELPLPSRE